MILNLDRPTDSRRSIFPRRNFFRTGALALRTLALFSATVVTLATSAPRVWAQAAAAGVVTGRVQSALTGNYLTNARVRVAGTNLEAFTNSAGEYRLTGVPAGQATLDVFYTG